MTEIDTLTIDGCSICQLKCVSCPATQMGYPFNVGQGHLKIEPFRRLLDDNPQFTRVCLDNIGELFLNPELPSIFEYAREKGVAIGCSTGVNLNHASPEALESLVRFGFDNLTCSIDGASPETYRIYRVGGDFDRVIANIRTINAFKQKYRSELPRLKWQFIVFGHNEHELPAARRMAEELGMEFYPKTAWDASYSPIRDRDFVLEQTGWFAATREEHERITGKNFARCTCYSLWISPRINFDGRVLGCCWNTWSDFSGNAFEEGYRSAIDSERMGYAKRMLLGKAAPRPDIPCERCEIFHSMKKSGEFLTEREIFGVPPPWYRAFRFLYRTLGLNDLRLKERMQQAVYLRRYRKLQGGNSQLTRY